MTTLHAFTRLFMIVPAGLGGYVQAGLLLRENAVQTWNSIKGAYDPSKQVLWDPDAGPTYKDIAQGTTGDCWLDASLASIAYADPNQLKTIINEPHNKDGTVTVTLCDNGAPSPYTVKKRTIDDMKQSFSNAAPYITGGDWVWPSVMEDAFVAFAKAHSDTKIDEKLNGGWANQAYSAVYGNNHAITWVYTENSPDDVLWGIFNQAVHRPTASASQAGSGTTSNGIPQGHMYSVIRCDQSTGMVTLRNPWGVVSQNAVGGSTSGGKGVSSSHIPKGAQHSVETSFSCA
ncbi:MAG: hypothetical protein Q9227_006215 [Pyrenula ochraceoflavens]